MQLEKILCEKFKYSSFKLAALSSKAPKKYRVYLIPKRNSGTRVIAQPTKELKEIQRFLVSVLKEHLHVHSSAMAYKENVSVKHNAFLHKDNPYLLKMDFQNFFNKIKPEFFFSKLDKLSLDLDYKDKYLLKSFLFWKPGLKRSVTHILSVGAPSSPFISNFVMYDFDKKISEWCKGYDITYSRYADDITFSTKRKGLLFSIPKVVKVMLTQHAMGITINESKTIFTSKKHNRHVTGVTLTSENKLSVGRKKKKHISSLIYKYSLGELNDEEVLHAKGLLSYCIHIEREFLNRMKVKYGSEVINRFLKEGCDE